jgi:hypothetical protein
VNSIRWRWTSLLALTLCLAAAACGGDVLLPDESRPAKITIVGGTDQSAVAGGVLPQPIVVRVTDARSRPVEGQTVVFTVATGGGSVTPGSAKTDVECQDSASWTFGGATGQQSVQAQVTGDGIPASLAVTFNATAVSGSGATLVIVSGDNQTGPVGSALADSLVVRVVDPLNNPVAGVEVRWSAAGGGSIAPETAVSDGNGLAAAQRVLGTTAGTQTSQAASGALASVSFTHTAVAANPTALLKISGDGQSAQSGATLTDSLVVQLVDDNGNGVGGKPVTWLVATGGGSVNPVNVITSPTGLAKTSWTLGPNAGSNGLNAVFSGLPSVPFTATGTSGVATKLAFIQPPVNTAAGASITPSVKVAIQDAGGNTVTGATDAITVAIGANPAGGTLSGTTTVSAVNGVATFPNLSIDHVGADYTLTAGGGGLADATSPTFDIVTGGANRLVFLVGPTDRVVGQKFSPALQVQVQDAGGNPVLLATGNITITSSVNGTLVGTSTATPLLGTATFSNLAINAAGTDYQLTAFSSGGGVASTTSGSFNVGQAGTTVAITRRIPTVSVTGQAVTVEYDVNIAAPGAGSPGGTVTVTDGTDSCTAGITVGGGTGSCQIRFRSAGTKSITATYNGDANFTGSTSSPPTSHLVNLAGTTLAIQSDTPDPSAPGETVIVQWTLVPNGAGGGTPTGDVTVRVSSGPEPSCSAPAIFGPASCSITLTVSGSRTLIAEYPGDANFNAAPSVNTGHVVDVPPVAGDDGANATAQDTPLSVPAPGVLANDSDPDGGPSPLIARNASDPANGSVTLGSDGSFTYTPDSGFVGTDTFTYEAFDGAAATTATVSITVGP